MVQSQTRLGGSGFTTMLFQNQRLAYLQNLQDTPPTPVAQAQAVQPMDESVPLEIVTAMAVGVGTLRCQFYELWNEPVWATLPGLAGTTNLLEVLKAQVNMGAITMQKIIQAPNGLMRGYVYHNVVITDIDQGESINIGTMTIPRTLTFQYPLEGSTKVITGEGTKELRDLANTEQKLLGIDGQWTLGTVKSFGIQQLHRVRMARGTQSKEVFATAEHRWILPDHSETVTVGLVPEQRLLTVDGPDWTVVSVGLTDRYEEVFCASVPEGHAFVLEGDLVTGNCYTTYI